MRNARHRLHELSERRPGHAAPVSVVVERTWPVHSLEDQTSSDRIPAFAWPIRRPRPVWRPGLLDPSRCTAHPSGRAGHDSARACIRAAPRHLREARAHHLRHDVLRIRSISRGARVQTTCRATPSPIATPAIAIPMSTRHFIATCSALAAVSSDIHALNVPLALQHC
jgi:hypothetical protein